ncbi:MAG: pyridoxal-phosphate dependent enzyme [bacterium]
MAFMQSGFQDNPPVQAQLMITLQTNEKAAAIMSGRIMKTPLVYSPNISRLVNAGVYLKLENLQKTGSFKIRGATHKLLVRKSEIGAQGVALGATLANIPSTIVMPGSKTLPLYTTRVEMELETRSQLHLEKIVYHLEAKGYQLELRD